MRNKYNFLSYAFFLSFFFFTGTARLFAYSEGVLLFTQNKFKEAIPLLEAEVAAGKAGADVYNYLGLAYAQTGEHKKAVEVFENAMKSPSTNKTIIQYNMGNSYFALKDYNNAAKCFTFSIEQDKKFSRAFLNRANSYLHLKRYIEAISDYTNFLKLDPKNPQRVKIIKLIGLLKEEQRRLDAEAAAQRQLTEEYSENPDFYEHGDWDELVEDNPDFYNVDEELSEIYYDENFGSPDSISDSQGEKLSDSQKKMLVEDAVILEEGRLAEEERQRKLEETRREEKRLLELRESEERFQKYDTQNAPEPVPEPEVKTETEPELIPELVTE